MSPDQNVSTSSVTVSQSTLMPPMQPSTMSRTASPVIPLTNDKQLEEPREPGNPEEQLVNTLQTYQTVEAAAEVITDSVL